MAHCSFVCLCFRQTQMLLCLVCLRYSTTGFKGILFSCLSMLMKLSVIPLMSQVLATGFGYTEYLSGKEVFRRLYFVIECSSTLTGRALGMLSMVFPSGFAPMWLFFHTFSLSGQFTSIFWHPSLCVMSHTLAGKGVQAWCLVHDCVICSPIQFVVPQRELWNHVLSQKEQIGLEVSTIYRALLLGTGAFV